MKFTIREFDAQFPDDAACLKHLFTERYGKSFACPECKKKCFYPVRGRRCYACSCGYQVYPTANTIFHRSRVPLKSWFFAIFLMSHAKNGMAANELHRHIGVKYQTAFRMLHQIRRLLHLDAPQLQGTVEVDETYIGGVQRRTRKPSNKMIVFGIAERERGKVYAEVVPNAKEVTLVPIIFNRVVQGATVMSDEHKSYEGVPDAGFTHYHVKHAAHQYADGPVHTNTIEGFWSQLKRGMDGTHHCVSAKYLQRYVDEYAFRWNHRDEQVFGLILAKAVQPFSRGRKSVAYR